MHDAFWAEDVPFVYVALKVYCLAAGMPLNSVEPEYMPQSEIINSNDVDC